MKLCVIGLGYIGFPTACMFAANGINVVGVDINQKIVSTLNNGGLHIQENGLQEVAQKAFASGNLIVSDRVEEADAFIIAVPTPFHEDKTADMRAVISAAESILPVLKRGDLVILESTSPPNTTLDLIKPILERSNLIAGSDFFLVYSPERVLPGQILKELIENSRVIGGINHASAEAGKKLYQTFVKGQIILTDATTAEMVKLMENTFRDVNIALANEFSRLGDRFGIDTYEAIKIANLHPRVNILKPGPGVGGHCISVDPWFLVEAASDITNLIRMARRVNDLQPEYVTHLIKEVLGCLENKRIAILGLSYKPDVDDLRESPSIEVASLLARAGAVVKAYEPYKLDVIISGIEIEESMNETISDAQAIVLLVDHKQFRNLKGSDLKDYTTSTVIIDATNSLHERDWVDNGFLFYRLGAIHNSKFSTQVICSQ